MRHSNGPAHPRRTLVLILTIPAVMVFAAAAAASPITGEPCEPPRADAARKTITFSAEGTAISLSLSATAVHEDTLAADAIDPARGEPGETGPRVFTDGGGNVALDVEADDIPPSPPTQPWRRWADEAGDESVGRTGCPAWIVTVICDLYVQRHSLAPYGFHDLRIPTPAELAQLLRQPREPPWHQG